MLAVDLPRDVEVRLDDAVSTFGRSRTDIMIEALRSYLDDMEDVRAAEAALADIRAGRSSTLSLDEVERSLGLAG